MTKKIFVFLLGCSLAAPAFARGPATYHGRYSDVYNGRSTYGSGYGHRPEYRRHNHSGRTAGTIAAIVGGAILGAAIAKSGQRTSASVAYVEPDFRPACYDRRVTEQTLSGRYVTYTETVCR